MELVQTDSIHNVDLNMLHFNFQKAKHPSHLELKCWWNFNFKKWVSVPSNNTIIMTDLIHQRISFQSNVTSRVVNQLLTEMDGLEARKSVFIMGATNRPGKKAVDSSSWPIYISFDFIFWRESDQEKKTFGRTRWGWDAVLVWVLCGERLINRG